MPITSKLKSAYVAGFVDGEGYISLKRGNSKESKYVFYTPVITVSSTVESIIYWLKESFGGWYYPSKPKNGKNWKDQYRWTLTGKNLRPFLQTIYPYLRIKKKQCELVLRKIKLQETIFDKLPFKKISQINENREGKRISNLAYREEQRSEIEKIYEELRKLNRRGIF